MPRVDDRRVLSAIILINRNDLRWCDAPSTYSPRKTLYNRWKRWSEKGIFAQMMVGLAEDHRETNTVMIDATCLKAHRKASSLGSKRGAWTFDWPHQGRQKPKLHAICDSKGRLVNLFVTAGQGSDYIGARGVLSGLPDINWLLADRGCDADWFTKALKDKGIGPCIPGRKQRKKSVQYDKRRYKRRNRIEIMFVRLKV